MLEQHYLTSLFEPDAVAVIGASDRENAVGNVIFKNILASGFKGQLFAINSQHTTVQGHQTYKSIEEIGARVDMAVIATRPQSMPKIIEQCGRCLLYTSHYDRLYHRSQARNFSDYGALNDTLPAGDAASFSTNDLSASGIADILSLIHI